MRTPTQDKSRGRQTVSSFISNEAPIGGWNNIDPLSNMQPTEAIVMDNFYPRTGYVESRGGSTEFATGMTGTGKTLVKYNEPSGVNQMFCSTDSGIFNVTASGAVGASVLARTNGKHQWLSFGDGTSDWLVMCNGVDKPAYYDGTTWTAVDGATSPALTGVTTTKLVAPNMFKGRLSFIEVNTLNWWYLSAGVAGGALTKFNLSGLCKQGGYLMAVITWSVDAGNGPNERIVFITSEGELIVFEGVNPASDFVLAGVYRISKPLGRKCASNIGSDVVILTQHGAFPLSALTNDNGVNYKSAVTNKIQTAFNDAARSYGNVFGWTAVKFPIQSAVLVNVPIVENGTHYQYVMNTITGAWCRFVGWDAEDLIEFNDGLYFCKGTTVYKAWTGSSDLGNNIDCYFKTAFNYFGQKGRNKLFKMYRPTIQSNGPVPFLSDIDVDFNDLPLIGTASAGASTSALWGSALWGISLWGAANIITKTWITPSCWQGFCGATKIKVSGKVPLKIISIDYMYEDGSVL